MKSFKIKKLNNQGSTFVLSLLVITLLTTLALALANASISNMMMKSMDRSAKKNFYTAESLLDEVRAGIGRDSVDCLAESYEKVLTTIVNNSSGTAVVKDNEGANKELKEAFMESVLKKITDNQMSFGDGTYVEANESNAFAIDNTITYIQSHIIGTKYNNGMGKVNSIGKIKAYKDSNQGYQWIIIIEDVAFSYKEEKAGEIQFSNITVDLEIEYPNMVVDFTANNKITDFINYTLIADDSITINDQTPEANANQVVNIHGSAYAGHAIDIVSPSVSGAGAVVNFSALTDVPIDVVCGGNNAIEAGLQSGTIRVGGNDTNPAEAHFKGTNIWCENLVTYNPGEGGAIITIDDKSNSYIKDDISAEAKNSNITVGGEYYGYMYDGMNSGHGASSAIIVNGKNTRMTINARKLMLGGHAYVDISNSPTLVQYMTGETLSLKGNQEVYLVPAEFLGMGYNSELQNPTSRDAWDGLVSAARSNSAIKVCEVPSTYFASKYVNAETPYVIKEINNMVYIYWNFKDKKSAAGYIKEVVQGSDPELKAILNRYNKNLFGNSNSVISVTTPAASIDASGIFMQSEAGVPSFVAPTGMSDPQIFTLTSTDLKNRYEIITHLLAKLPWDSGNARYYVLNSSTSLEQIRGITVESGELSKTNIIENVIDTGLLEAEGYNTTGQPYTDDADEKKYVKMAIDNADLSQDLGNPYIVPDGINYGNKKIDGGIIVATGDVVLNHDFYGLIISGGDIQIVGDAKLTTNPDFVERLITDDPEFRKYFRAYKSAAVEEDSREEIKIENVDYKDLVKFNNWRKYEDN